MLSSFQPTLVIFITLFLSLSLFPSLSLSYELFVYPLSLVICVRDHVNLDLKLILTLHDPVLTSRFYD